MDDHHITSLLGQSPDAHWNDSRSGLTVIAESSSGPSVALPEINVFGGDVAASAPSRKSTQRSDPQDLEAKLADESITHEQHKPISRTDTAGAQSWKSKITQNFHHLSRTASNESNFAPRTPVRNSTIQTNASASFDDTAPWDKKAILSLDGGGIRGYSALLMIRALMEAIGELERNYRATSATSAGPAASSYHPILPNVSATTDAAPMNSQAMDDPPATATSPWLPCHYFDYMAGTSTGGLISIMLGRLRMNVDDCIRDYETFGARVFGRSRWFSIRMSPFLWIRDKYDNKILEEVVKSVVRERGPKIAGFPGGQNFAFDENRCRVVVVAYQQTESDDAGKPYLFRTYKNLHRSKDNETRKALDLNPGLAHDIPIWQVARATSAAPTYFKAAKIDGLEYLDGGFGGTNNPSKEICDEVLTMNNRAKGCLNVVVSIGTGKNKKLSRWRSKKSWMPAGRYINFMNFAKKWASQSETQHNDMIRDQRNYEFEYFRLNVETGLDEMKLDEWRARGKIRTEAGRCVGKLRAKLRTHMHKASSTATAGSYGTEKPSNTSEEDESTVSSNKTLASSDDLVPHCLRPRNKTIEYITEHTNKYLQQPEVQEWVRECAVILVEGRRRRALSDPGRWEKTCFDTWYQCTVPKCPRGEKKYESINGIRQHLLDKHRDRFRPEPENSLDEKALKKALVESKVQNDNNVESYRLLALPQRSTVHPGSGSNQTQQTSSQNAGAADSISNQAQQTGNQDASTAGNKRTSSQDTPDSIFGAAGKRRMNSIRPANQGKNRASIPSSVLETTDNDYLGSDFNNDAGNDEESTEKSMLYLAIEPKPEQRRDLKKYGDFGGTNNPSKEICDEVLTMNNRAKGCLNIVVSIGIGKTKSSADGEASFLEREYQKLLSYR